MAKASTCSRIFSHMRFFATAFILIFVSVKLSSRSPEAFAPIFLNTSAMTRFKTAASRAGHRVSEAKSRVTPLKSQESSSSAPSDRGDGIQPKLGCNTIVSLLSRMTSYFYSMVDRQSHRFYYRCLPESGVRVHGHSPIRDLGSSWDTTTLLDFWSTMSKPEIAEAFKTGDSWGVVEKELSSAVKATVEEYGSGPWHMFKDSQKGQCVALSSKLLREPSNIAHSAFLILASTGALRLSIIDTSTSRIPINNLVNGILSMEQDESGAFAIHFGSRDVLKGIEFYPGEAMLALLDIFYFSAAQAEASKESTQVLAKSTQHAILPAIERGFRFYSDYYHRGNIDSHYTSFFGNWQVQCFAKLWDVLREQELKSKSVPADDKSDKPSLSSTLSEMKKSESTVTSDAVAKYVFELCDAIISSQSWQQLMKGHYKSMATVEIACGLEALADGTRIALELLSESSSMAATYSERQDVVYWPYIEKAVQFLTAVQNQVPENAIGSGGLGHALLLSEQRLDVTGHAVNALVKVYNVRQKLPYEEDGVFREDSSRFAP